ncbi:MAG TPA: bile acid:sodium symporter family protein [Hyphomicrobiales bacterium]|nr:bile acid:sodium symporter family protein [Hyphomicrobiales bacterium]
MPPARHRQSTSLTMLKKLLPDTFLLTLIGTVVLATVLPAHGSAATYVNWLATLSIVVLFFFHGAKLSRQSVVAGLTHWRLHGLILVCTFVVFPLLGLGMALLFPTLLSPALWTGVLFLAALPSTVQSSIAFVSIAKGNVAAAVAAASASQILGVLLTPLLVGLMSGTRSDGIPLSGIGDVAAIILLPFVVGHLARPWIAEFVNRYKSVIGITDRATILIAVYSAFSAAVIEGLWGRLPLPELGVLTLLCCVILAIMLLATRGLARLCRFPREDEIVVLFCGTKKSLVQGIPMARVLFAGPDLGLILLPIMLFHQIQLMVCAGIARRYGERFLEAEGATHD